MNPFNLGDPGDRVKWPETKEEVSQVFESGETFLGVRPCLCDDKKCEHMRIFIVNPQIDNDSAVYATLDRKLARELISALREIMK